MSIQVPICSSRSPDFHLCLHMFIQVFRCSHRSPDIHLPCHLVPSSRVRFLVIPITIFLQASQSLVKPHSSVSVHLDPHNQSRYPDVHLDTHMSIQVQICIKVFRCSSRSPDVHTGPHMFLSFRYCEALKL